MMPTRRALLAAAALAALPGRRAGAEGPAGLVVYGMPATPSVVLARAAALVAATRPGTRFEVWRTADQMRAGAVGGTMDLYAAPTYSAANLFNRGAALRLVNVLTWGLLYGLARDPGLTRIEDLAGKTVLLAARHDAPDLLFRLVLAWAGLDPERDVTLTYSATSAEVVPLFLAGRGDVAILPEPAATTALVKAKQAGQTLHRTLDVTEIYGRKTGRGARIPQAGLCVSEALLARDPAGVAAVAAACHDAAAWIAGDPAAAGALGAGFLGLPAAIVQASLPQFRLDVVDAADARADLELYFSNLMTLSPDIVGGRLPDARFYAGRP
jgi:NitT/TauT family transport system substrate-binding protein